MKFKKLNPIAFLKELRGTIKIVTWPTIRELFKRFATVVCVSAVSAFIVFVIDLLLGRLFTLVM